jgi:hypothetical protein
MWKQCPKGLTGNDCEIGMATTFNWQVALQIPETINSIGGFAVYTDWRLPNIKELSSITEEQCHSPALNLNIFPTKEPSGSWSSSPEGNQTNDISNFSYAWSISFNSQGFIGSRGRVSNADVRLVRTEQ